MLGSRFVILKPRFEPSMGSPVRREGGEEFMQELRPQATNQGTKGETLKGTLGVI